jgi:hypothetical protein
MGGLIGSQSVGVAAGDDEILIFPWMPPNPADYASFGADQSHFCLLARIETASAAPYGMTSPETSDLYSNVQNNNNIVWKNITVVDDVPGSGRTASATVATFADEIARVTLVFLTPKGERPSVFDWGRVFVDLPDELFGRLNKKADNSGVRAVEDTTFEVLKRGARLGPFELAPDELFTLQLRFLASHKHPLGARVFAIDLVQKEGNRVMGGVRFILKSPIDRRFVADDHPPHVFDGVTWGPRGGVEYSCSCQTC